MSFENIQWTWMNGEFVPWAESTVPLSTHALHYGTGVFEGIRSYLVDGEPAIFRLDAHLDRFYKSAAVYGLRIPFSPTQLTEAICGLIRRNGLTESYIRPIAYMGAETLGIRAQCSTDTAILAWPQMVHVSEQSRRRGARLTVSPYRKFDARMMPTTAKACGQYLNSRLATMEASRRGYDEALLLNIDGNVAEAAVANIFLVNGRTLHTNDDKSSILMGITRDSILQLAVAEGFRVEVGTITVDDLRQADEVFLCGTACEIVPVAELDGSKIGRTSPGPVTEQICRAFDLAKTGTSLEWRHWLHPVAEMQVAGLRC
ncbi:MAG: branched-chain amino acid transaminase [Acidobacteriia bacterium]|nr:branched-chain amino acid transaminase [Terriglobia bacterium]